MFTLCSQFLLPVFWEELSDAMISMDKMSQFILFILTFIFNTNNLLLLLFINVWLLFCVCACMSTLVCMYMVVREKSVTIPYVLKVYISSW